ncbi:lipoprotein N-acyltransferase Lnb domain-containing protein [Lysobacter fragariae]
MLWLAPLCAFARVGVGAVSATPPSPTTDASAPRIGIAVMQPGEIFWERFGHDAILVVDPATGAATSYNFGFFDPSDPDFVSRFVRGDMRYRLAALPFDDDLYQYREEGRGVVVNWLDLDPSQSRELAAALATNALPQNAFYRYDYFKDNCSTRVRDAIDRVLQGGLRKQVEGRSQGLTWRSEAVRLASPAPWMWLAFDIGLGPQADAPMTLWEEAYVPRRLSDSMREAKNSHGRPLVMSQEDVLPHRIAPEPQEQPLRWWLWGLWGIALAIGGAWQGSRRPRALALVASGFWLLSGVLGAVMLFLWFGTAHTMGWGNHNLFLLNPLAWAALPGAWQVLRGRAGGPWFGRIVLAIALVAAAGLFTHWIAAAPQRNVHWIVLLLPVHVALAWTFRGQTLRAGALRGTTR